MLKLFTKTFHEACLLNDLQTVKEMFTEELVLCWRKTWRTQVHRLLRRDCVDVVRFLLPYVRKTLLKCGLLYKVRSVSMLQVLRPTKKHLKDTLSYFLSMDKPWDYQFRFLIQNGALVSKQHSYYYVLNRIRGNASTLGPHRNKLIQNFTEPEPMKQTCTLTPFFFWPCLRSVELWFQGYRPIQADLRDVPQFIAWHLVELIVCVVVKRYLPLPICDILNEYLFVRCKSGKTEYLLSLFA